MRRKKVVVLNFANGERIGGGYARGAKAQEEDLCRAFPSLYGSLGVARDNRCYPFGPPAGKTRYSDVLVTLDLICMRTDEDEGWALLEEREMYSVDMVSAAAPNIPKGEPVYEDFISSTYANIMVAPKLGNPDVDVLILGALGCGAFRGDPVLMAKLWVPFLTSPAFSSLYSEIHFAIPPGENYDAFNQVLSQHVKLTVIQ
jgi:uncharacterized protein (TIGR02452 family)